MAEPTNVDLVRLLIADTDSSNQLLSDPQVSNFLTLEGGNVKLAAAQALDAIASSEALVSKVIKSQDLSTDGPKVAASLREHARSLRTQAVEEDEGDGFFEIVDVVSSGSYPELTEHPYPG